MLHLRLKETLSKKKQNIDERFILLRDIILLRKNQLVTSYSLKKANRHFVLILALSNCKHVQKPVV